MIIINKNRGSQIYGTLMCNENIINKIKSLNLKQQDTERLIFISTQFSKMNDINMKKQHQNEEDCDNTYIQIYSLKLMEIFGRFYQDYLNILKDCGYLNQDKSENNNKSYSNISNECTKYYQNEPNGLVVEVAITSKSLYNNFYIFSNNNLKFIKLIDNYKKVLYSININKDIINEFTIEGIKSISDDFDVENLLKKEIRNLNKLRVINSQSVNNYVLIDDFSERLHTQITNLSKNYRKYLELDGERLVELDITNSQPQIGSLIIGDDQFTQDCIDGIIYEKFIDEKYNREKVKKSIYFILFGGQQKVGYGDVEFLNKFKGLYPQAWINLCEINKDDYKSLVRELQKKESDLMIKNVQVRLFENNIKAITIHDSIMVKPSDLKLTKEILEEEILKMGLKLPKIKMS